VRTTVDIPDDLLAEATARAVRESRSLSEVVADAVRSSFARTSTAGREKRARRRSSYIRRPRAAAGRRPRQRGSARADGARTLILPDVNVLVYVHRGGSAG